MLDSTEVLELRKKTSNIYKWKEKVQKNTQLSFWWKAKSSRYETIFLGIQSSLFCSRLRTRSAHRLGLPRGGGGGTQQSFQVFSFQLLKLKHLHCDDLHIILKFYTGGSAPMSNPLPFCRPFLTEKVPFSYTFIGKWYPFHIPT